MDCETEGEFFQGVTSELTYAISHGLTSEFLLIISFIFSVGDILHFGFGL